MLGLPVLELIFSPRDVRVVGERGIIRAATFAGYLENPKFTADPHHGSDVTGHGSESMYPNWDYSNNHAWAMVIDTTVCTGCNGCVIACQAENNIATVGKEEVVREREMHWLRIDRYFETRPPRRPTSSTSTSSRCRASTARTRPASWSAPSRPPSTATRARTT